QVRDLCRREEARPEKAACIACRDLRSRWSQVPAPKAMHAFQKSLGIANEAVPDSVVVLERSSDLVSLVAGNHDIGTDVAGIRWIELDDLSTFLAIVGAVVAVVHVVGIDVLADAPSAVTVLNRDGALARPGARIRRIDDRELALRTSDKAMHHIVAVDNLPIR